MILKTLCSLKFQSRNRGSFDFKRKRSHRGRSGLCFNLVIEVLLISSLPHEALAVPQDCFNLVIEVLLISSAKSSIHVAFVKSFQSRNRGSFDFKSFWIDFC